MRASTGVSARAAASALRIAFLPSLVGTPAPVPPDAALDVAAADACCDTLAASSADAASLALCAVDSPSVAEYRNVCRR